MVKRRRLNFIDLQKHFDVLRKHVGFSWVALRSAKLDTRCSECARVVGSQYDQTNPNCKTCLGIGHAFTDKLVKARKSDRSSAKKFLTEIGAIGTDTKNFFIESDVFPKTSDFILELDLDELTGSPVQPFRIRRAYKIQSTAANRGKKGRIEYWNCLAERRSFDLGRTVISRPIAREAPVVLTPVYELYVTMANNELNGIDVRDDFTFSYHNIVNQDVGMTLTPRVSPPAGKLFFEDINGETNNIIVHPRS